MTERNKVIEALEACVLKDPDDSRDCKHCPRCNYGAFITNSCINGVMADALTLLKAQEPRGMTWREVIGAALECKPVYIEVRDSEDKERGDDRWAMVTQYKDSITNGMIRAMSSFITSEILFADCYGKTWRCWTSRPTDEQRRAVKWE